MGGPGDSGMRRTMQPVATSCNEPPAKSASFASSPEAGPRWKPPIGIFRNLLESGDLFVYEADGAIVGFCKATRLPADRTMWHISGRSRLRRNFTVTDMPRRC